MSDEDRDAILARRRRFVTIALATAGVTAGCDRSPPPPEPIPVGTQEIEPSGEEGAGGAPMPCLSIEAPPEPEEIDAGAGDASDAGTKEDAGVPELPKPPPATQPPIPRVCLRMVPPPDGMKK